MNRNVIIGTVLVMIIISTVLFLCNEGSSEKPKTDNNQDSLAISDSTLVIIPETPVLKFDSIVQLGYTGYSIGLPNEFVVTTDDDTSFVIKPAKADTGCVQTMTLRFWDTQGSPAVGVKPLASVPVTVLGVQATFKEYGRTDLFCRIREGGIALDKTYNLQVNCNAPPDYRMERLFGMLNLLHKVDVPVY